MARVERVDVAVVGGGIAGLSAAHEAVSRGLSVALFEAGDAVGGKMASRTVDGYLVECGPHSFLSSAARLWQLIDRVRLRSRVMQARPPADRFVYRGGTLRKLPSNPLTALSGDWMTYAGRARAALEPLIAGNPRADESVDSFFRRRFGDGVADGLVAPFVSGIYAGDPRQLGAADAFPKLWQMEQDHGSVIKALVKSGPPKASSTAPARGMYGFDTGLGGLAQAIGDGLPAGSVRCGATLRGFDARDPGYRLRFDLTETTETGRARRISIDADKIVLALPAAAAAELVRDAAPDAADALAATVLAPVALVHLGGPDRDARAPSGFGALIAPGEGVDALGILFPSALFEGRAPAGCWLHSVFLGGATAADVVTRSDDELIEAAVRSHRKVISPLIGGDLAVEFSHVVRHHAAIPQYVVGHRKRIAAARAAMATPLPGVMLAGACYDGISVSDAAASGCAAIVGAG